jgi:hypothetical protein
MTASERSRGHLDRTPSVWEVKLQSPDGATITEKVEAFWAPTFEGVKEAVATAARCKAWLRNKKKVQFVAVSEPTLVSD